MLFPMTSLHALQRPEEEPPKKRTLHSTSASVGPVPWPNTLAPVCVICKKERKVLKRSRKEQGLTKMELATGG